MGETRAELGGSLLHELLGLDGGAAPAHAGGAAARATGRCTRRSASGLVQACHDLSEGGLAVALAEMCIAGRLGAEVEIAGLRDSAATSTDVSDPTDLLFSESNGRLLVEVAPEDAPAFEALLAEECLSRIGAVATTGRLVIREQERNVLEVPVEALANAWKRIVQVRKDDVP